MNSMIFIDKKWNLYSKNSFQYIEEQLEIKIKEKKNYQTMDIFIKLYIEITLLRDIATDFFSDLKKFKSWTIYSDIQPQCWASSITSMYGYKRYRFCIATVLVIAVNQPASLVYCNFKYKDFFLIKNSLHLPSLISVDFVDFNFCVCFFENKQHLILDF